MANLLLIVLFVWITAIQLIANGIIDIKLLWLMNLKLKHNSACTSTCTAACSDGDVRLRGGRHNREGRVEVCRNQP